MMRVALYAGVFMQADAISTSVRYKLDLLRRLAAQGVPLEATVFTHGSDIGDPAVWKAGTPHDVARTEVYRDIDLHVFEYGIEYELFNTIWIIPADRLKVAVYHNVTPPELAHSFEMREVLNRSIKQRHNLFLADRVLCVSEFNRDDLVELGIAPERLSVLHLPPAIVPPPHRERDDDTVELLFVGRFVPAKGVLDLVRATAQAVRNGVTGMRVTLAGNPAFSSPQCMREVEELIRAEGLGSVVRLVISPAQDALAQLYACSDALVAPSYHEGYCMPVVEAFLSQCHVIAYDSSNLPFIVSGLGTLVPTGDVAALSAAIVDFVQRSHEARRPQAAMQVPTGDGALPEDEWRRRVAEHVERHSLRAFEQGFIEVLRWAAERRGHDDVLRALDRLGVPRVAA